MPKKIICENVQTKLRPSGGIETIPCNGEYFETVQGVTLVNPFESKNGQHGLIMEPALRCASCGDIKSLAHYTGDRYGK